MRRSFLRGKRDRSDGKKPGQTKTAKGGERRLENLIKGMDWDRLSVDREMLCGGERHDRITQV